MARHDSAGIAAHHRQQNLVASVVCVDLECPADCQGYGSWHGSALRLAGLSANSNPDAQGAQPFAAQSVLLGRRGLQQSKGILEILLGLKAPPRHPFASADQEPVGCYVPSHDTPRQQSCQIFGHRSPRLVCS
jgi:hypothetical protein